MALGLSSCFPGMIVARGCAKGFEDFGLSALFSGEIFLKIVVTDYRPISKRQGWDSFSV
jgi:hypothetical protein